MKRFAPVLALAVFAIAGCDSDNLTDNLETAEEPFAFAVELTTQTRLTVNGINGGIVVTGSSRTDSVFITGFRRVTADTQEEAEERLDDIDVRVESGAAGVTVTTLQPSTPTGVNYIVEYEISVPEGFEARINNANGGVVVSGLEGAVSVDNANGGIELDDMAGDVFVDLGNGGVVCEAVLALNGNIVINVGNGSINLSIPTSTSAEFSATVGNGSVSVTNLTLDPVTATTRSVVGVLGDGEGDIQLTLGNGEIVAVGF